MSRVDVLAVMAELAAHLDSDETQAAEYRRAIEARAAVAELIAALAAERDIRNSECKPPIDIELAAYIRTDIALVNVGAVP